MISVINPLATEYASARRRDFAFGLIAIGYPPGGILAGASAAILLGGAGGWRSLFGLGAILSASMIPVAWALLPEPLGILIERPGPRLLGLANRLLSRFGHPPVDALPRPGLARVRRDLPTSSAPAWSGARSRSR